MRLINADALIKSVPDTAPDIFENCRNCKLLDGDQVIDLIEKQPVIDAVQVIHAHWNQDSDGTLYCSKCGRPTYDSHDVPIEFNGMKGLALVWPYYCGFCGSKMDEEVECL